MHPPRAGSTDLSDLQRLTSVADEAAARGAEVVARAAGEPRGHGTLKGVGDYVTAIDRESEVAITAILRSATPDVPILAEEGGGERGEAFWAVDPLDGTTNFLIGFPVVAVSVGLVHRGRPVAGAIRAPLLGMAFTAVRGGGAWSGSRRLRVSARPAARGIVATGFPFRDRSFLPRYLPAFRRILEETEDIRRPGAAALDLAWVAAGVFDGYFELNLSVWDLAAGSLLVEEAGGVVSDWDGGDAYLDGHILAGSRATHAVLLEAATAEE